MPELVERTPAEREGPDSITNASHQLRQSAAPRGAGTDRFEFVLAEWGAFCVTGATETSGDGDLVSREGSESIEELLDWGLGVECDSGPSPSPLHTATLVDELPELEPAEGGGLDSLPDAADFTFSASVAQISKCLSREGNLLVLNTRAEGQEVPFTPGH